MEGRGGGGRGWIWSRRWFVIYLFFRFLPSSRGVTWRGEGCYIPPLAAHETLGITQKREEADDDNSGFRRVTLRRHRLW